MLIANPSAFENGEAEDGFGGGGGEGEAGHGGWLMEDG